MRSGAELRAVAIINANGPALHDQLRISSRIAEAAEPLTQRNIRNIALGGNLFTRGGL